MDRRVDRPTTRVVGPIKRRDQREEHHTKAATGELGPVVQKRWTSDSVDPLRRIFFPESRARNVPHRSWRDVADGPLNPERVEVENPARMTEIVKGVATWLGAALVGVAELDQAFVFTHHGLRIDFHKGRAGQPIDLPHRYAISMAIPMEHENLRNSPSFVDGAAVGKAYMESSKLAVHLAAYIRELGWPAKAHFFINEDVLHVPIAVTAGLGELARNGSIITRRFGPRVRLSTVTTDLPLVADRPIDIGVQDLCGMCNKCAANCPAQAIPSGAKVVTNGIERWQIDNDKCMTFWVANRARFNDCARCIATCPWNVPDTRLQRALTWGIPRWRWWRRAFLWLDDRRRGLKPNPAQEWLYYKVPGDRSTWTIPKVIE
ncbi:MAG: 4Fe-4S dicluster domain-containing protein [Candidatus Rokubacteria bacterium]|nr:4Fe-4S dicluster domain-containing protein [Candidatus Rokubacteria bacterium]